MCQVVALLCELTLQCCLTLQVGLALAVLRYDEGDSFNRSGVVTEAHAMVLDLLAAVFRIPGAA